MMLAVGYNIAAYVTLVLDLLCLQMEVLSISSTPLGTFLFQTRMYSYPKYVRCYITRYDIHPQ